MTIKLKRCRYSNIKDQSGDAVFRPVTLITGDNQAGKSSLVLGVSETIAPTHSFPWHSGGQAESEVVFETDAGPLVVSRAFDPKHTASIVPGMPRGKIKEVDARIGDQIATRTALQVQSFADLTAGARAERVLLTAASIPNTVPQSDAALRLATPREWWEPADKGGLGLRRPLDFRPSILVPWISDALSEARKAKTAASAAKKLADAQVQALALAEVPAAGTLPEAKASREALRKAHAEATAKKAAVERSSDALVRMQAQIAEHEAALAKHRAAPAAAATVKQTEAEHAAQIAAAQKLAAEADALEATLTALEEAGTAAAKAATTAHNAEIAARQAYADATRVLDHTACPVCSEPLADGTPAHARLAQRAEEAKAALTEAEEALGAANAAYTEARVRYAAARDEARAARQRATETQRAAESARSSAVSVATRLRSEHSTAIARSESAVEALRKQIAETPCDVDPDLLAVQIEALEADLAESDAAIAALERAQQHEVDRMAAKLKQDGAADRFELAKAAEVVLKTWRDAIVEPAVSRIESTAARIVAQVLPGTTLRVVLDETGKGATLVFERGGRQIVFGGWSGSERIVASIAAHVAMLEAEAPPWKVVICDEVQTCHKRILPRLVAALAALTEDGTLDNVILAGALEDHLPRIDPAVLAQCAVIDMDAALAAQEAA